MTATNTTSSRGTVFQSSLACELQEIRPAVLAVKEYLADEGLNPGEINACELALTEACNNAVEYASNDGRSKPVDITITCDRSHVELRINDHTAGFSMPDQVVLPELESTSGRGLFLMHSLMDQVEYLRGTGNNTLVLRKARSSSASQAPSDVRLAESEETIRNMAKELCFRSESLAAIFRCGAELGHANSVENFSEGLLHDLLDIIFADWFVLRVVRQNTGRLRVLASSEPGMDLDALTLADENCAHSVEVKAAITGQDVWFDTVTQLAGNDPLFTAVGPDAKGLVRPLMMGKNLVGTLTVGKSDATQASFTATQLQVVRTFADYLAIQIVNAKFQEEVVASRLVTREMEIAKNIQHALLPKSLPRLKNFSLAGFCQSAHQVGGDFYDVLQLSPDTALLIVADVMGKGVPAAMFAAVFAATVRGLVQASPEWARQPSQLLSRVNRQMAQELSEVDMFITAQLVFLDVAKRELIAANAGHCPLFIGTVHQSEVTAISPEGMPLGILPDATFADATVALQENSRILLYTDGLTEARDEQGEFYGQERLLSWFRSSLKHRHTADELKQLLIIESSLFKSDHTPPDDQTFLIVAEENEGC